jgi:hypothetical protein
MVKGAVVGGNWWKEEKNQLCVGKLGESIGWMFQSM